VRIFLTILGAIIFLYSLFKIIPIIGYEGRINEYAKGYLWGNAFLLLAGALLILFARRFRKKG